MSNVTYMFAQIFGLVATILLCSAYFVKNKKMFLFFNIAGDTLYGLTFVFVGSTGAGLICFFSCVQCLLVLMLEKKGKKLPKCVAICFILSFIGLGLLDFSSCWDIIPILTYVWFTIALYFDDMSKIRYVYLFANLSLAVYDVMVKAYSNALEDGIESMIILSVIIVEIVKSRNVKRKNQNSATLKGNQLGRGVIGVINFDLQSLTPRMQSKHTHNTLNLPFDDNHLIAYRIHDYG